jgi:hypothetical protein
LLLHHHHLSESDALTDALTDALIDALTDALIWLLLLHLNVVASLPPSAYLFRTYCLCCREPNNLEVFNDTARKAFTGSETASRQQTEVLAMASCLQH